MGPFMVEIVLCRVTRRGRKLKKGMNKAGKENMRNDGPSTSYIPADDMVKITLDLSENGPVFSALDEMMMRMMMEEEERDGKKGKKTGSSDSGGSSQAKKALKNLLKSGIPGIEKMFGPPSKGKPVKGFHKMNEGSKKKFMKAIFGEDGSSIESGTAAALLAATCSGGDPEIGERIAGLLVPKLSSSVDPLMMAALMTACSLIGAGAKTEEVLKIMKRDLSSSGFSEEDIFEKTSILMKAFGKDEEGSLAEFSLVNKQKNSGLKKIGLSPKDFSQIVLLQRMFASCGASPENIAKSIMIQNQLSKRGAQERHIAEAFKKIIDSGKLRDGIYERCKNALLDLKGKKEDVFSNVKIVQALESENDPSWKEVKAMKDILAGASPNSAEAIELNLGRALKTAGLSRMEITACLTAQRVLSILDIDPSSLAQVMLIQKTLVENGIPPVEIARVLSDGIMPKKPTENLIESTLSQLTGDFCPSDVSFAVRLYESLKLKSNIPLETIEHIDNTLIQVRCCLEDVADNTLSALTSSGEMVEGEIYTELANTLKSTGATVEIVGTTMMGSLTKVLPNTEVEIMTETGRTLTKVGYDKTDVANTMTEIVLNILEVNPDVKGDAIKSCHLVLTEAGTSPEDIQSHLEDTLPPSYLEPEPEIEILEEPYESIPEEDTLSQTLPSFDSSSRRGSLLPVSRRGSVSIGGSERRGSFYGEEVSKRSSVAIIVDDPENQLMMVKTLNDVFDAEMEDTIDGEETNISDSELTEIKIKKLMQVFKMKGSIHNIGGISRFRTVDDVQDTIINSGLDFDDAIAHFQRNMIVPDDCSEEIRSMLFAQILNSQEANSDATLQLTSFLNKKNDEERQSGSVDLSSYKELLSRPKRWKNTETSNVDHKEIGYRHPCSFGIGVIETGNQILVPRRRSIKLTSSAIKSQLDASLAADKESRRITGLRRSKVPLIVYSCGGYSRCFRIARFHTVDGPPIGVFYDKNLRKNSRISEFQKDEEDEE